MLRALGRHRRGRDRLHRNLRHVSASVMSWKKLSAVAALVEPAGDQDGRGRRERREESFPWSNLFYIYILGVKFLEIVGDTGFWELFDALTSQQ